MAASSHKLGKFVGELRRRHVFRVAAAYAVGAFVVLQVADTTFAALSIPDAVTRFLVVGTILGFPIAIVLAWAIERGAPADEATSVDGASVTLPATLVSPRVVAVVPFSVLGSEEYADLREGMVDLLSSKLRVAGELRSVDPHALLSLGAREGGPGLDPDSGRMIAKRFGAGLFVLGSIIEAGGRLHIEATLYEANGALSVVTEATAEGAASALFELVDNVARQLLTALTGGPAASMTRLAVTTTASFPALKEYLEGESEMHAMRRAPAVGSFQRAVEQDPSFALAWYRLGIAAIWSGQLELARDAVERAVALSDRLSEHNRRLVEAFNAFLKGNAGEAERLYRAIVGNHPDNIEAWYQLGEVLFHYRPRQGGSILESVESWERVLALEPEHVSALVHMAVIAAVQDDHERVDALVERALDISPEGDAVVWMTALRAWEQGDRAAQQRIARKLRASSDFSVARCAWYVSLPSRDLQGPAALARLLTESTRSAEVQAVGHLWLAHLELAQGRWSGAQGELARVERVHPASAIAYRGLLFLTPFLERPQDELEAIRAAVSEWDVDAVPRCMLSGAYFTVHNDLHPQLQLYLLGMLAARLGEYAVAIGHAESLERVGGRPEAKDLALDQGRSVRAAVDWHQGRAQEALRALEPTCMGALFELTIASPFFSQAYERFMRAELLHSIGRSRDALLWYGTFAEHSIYDLIYLAPSHFRRAEIYEQLGEQAEAVRHYRKFTDLWRDCDSELRSKIDHATARLEGLSEEATRS